MSRLARRRLIVLLLGLGFLAAPAVPPGIVGTSLAAAHEAKHGGSAAHVRSRKRRKAKRVVRRHRRGARKRVVVRRHRRRGAHRPFVGHFR